MADQTKPLSEEDKKKKKEAEEKKKKAEKNRKLATKFYQATAISLYIFFLVFAIWLTIENIENGIIELLAVVFEILVFAFLAAHFTKKHFKSKEDYLENKSLEDMEKEFKDEDSKMSYLLRRVDYSYQKFKRGTSWNYGNVKFYKYSTIVLSTTATIILGLNLGFFGDDFSKTYSEVANDVALVLNAIVAALATLSTFWNIEKYWIQNKVIKQQLKMLKFEVEFANSTLKGDEANTKADEFFKKYIKILRDFYLYWEGVLSEENRNGEGQNGAGGQNGDGGQNGAGENNVEGGQNSNGDQNANGGNGNPANGDSTPNDDQNPTPEQGADGEDPNANDG